MSEWTPVTQRTPIVDDDGVCVLVYGNGRNGIAWYGWGMRETDGLERYGMDDFNGIAPHWHWVGGDVYIPPLDITHWMPFPDLPNS